MGFPRRKILKTEGFLERFICPTSRAKQNTQFQTVYFVIPELDSNHLGVSKLLKHNEKGLYTI